MLGTDLPHLDSESLSLITNEEVLSLNRHSHGARQVMRDKKQCVWQSFGDGCPAKGQSIYLALFNLSDYDRDVSVNLSEVQGLSADKLYTPHDMWAHKDLFPIQGSAELCITVKAHDAVLLKL